MCDPPRIIQQSLYRSLLDCTGFYWSLLYSTELSWASLYCTVQYTPWPVLCPLSSSNSRGYSPCSWAYIQYTATNTVTVNLLGVKWCCQRVAITVLKCWVLSRSFLGPLSGVMTPCMNCTAIDLENNSTVATSLLWIISHIHSTSLRCSWCLQSVINLDDWHSWWKL